MPLPEDPYREYVNHPRHGRRPHFTGLDVAPGDDVHLHWHSPAKSRIANTAVPADLDAQTPATVPVTHYFDVERTCVDCHRRFLFFADEQKHWYEELGFPLEADCVRCVECRKQAQGDARVLQRYEQLFHREPKSAEDYLELAECCVHLMERGLFPSRGCERARHWLRVGSEEGERERSESVVRRLSALERAETDTTGR